MTCGNAYLLPILTLPGQFEPVDVSRLCRRNRSDSRIEENEPTTLLTFSFFISPSFFLCMCGQANLTHLGRNEYVPGVGMGIAKCPFDPSDNSTAVWVERGNPGDLPALYSGTNAEFTKADAVIFRTDLYNYTTGRREYTFKRTLKYDSKWLDSKPLEENLR